MIVTVVGLFALGTGLIGLCTRWLGPSWEEARRWPPWYDGASCPSCGEEDPCSCGEGA